MSRVLPQYMYTVLQIIRFLYSIIPSKTFTTMLYSFEIISKLIVLVAFLIDVFYFKQLNYFYKTLGLLLLPLFTTIISYAMRQFYKDNINAIISFIDSRPIPGTELHEFCFFYDHFTIDLEYFLQNHLYPVFDVVYMLAYIKKLRRKLNFLKINLVICFAYLVGWSYILFVGFGM